MAETDLIEGARSAAHAGAVVIGGRRLTIEDVVSIARQRAPVVLSADPAWRALTALMAACGLVDSQGGGAQ